MTIITHYAITFLLILAVAYIFGLSFTPIGIVAIVVIGNLIDFDYLFARLIGAKGASHHDFPSHTLIGVITIWLLSSLLVIPTLGLTASVLILASLLLHLIVDDAFRWLYYLKLKDKPKYFEITWFYPLQKKPSRVGEHTKSILEYIKYMKGLILVEFSSIAMSLLVIVYLYHGYFI